MNEESLKLKNVASKCGPISMQNKKKRKKNREKQMSECTKCRFE